MIRPDCEPTSNVSPYRRVDVNDSKPVTKAEPETIWEAAASELERRQKSILADHIWRCVEQTARGTNSPVRANEPCEAPNSYETSVHVEWLSAGELMERFGLHS